MKPRELVQLINDAKLSPDISGLISDLVATMPENEEVSNEVLDKVMLLINLDVDADTAELEILEAGMEELTELISTISQEKNKVVDEVSAASENMYLEAAEELEEKCDEKQEDAV